MLSLQKHLIASLALSMPAFANVFTISAYLPGSNLTGQVINAGAEAFYLGLATPDTYCPTTVDPSCPNVTGTVVVGMAAMYVEVPGGQEIYVNVNGAISYTQAHSAAIPVGAYVSGFTNATVSSNCTTNLNVLTWQVPDNSTSKGGILACPNIPSYMNGTATYQIYARTPAFNQTNCVELQGLLPNYLSSNASFGAWQYT